MNAPISSFSVRCTWVRYKMRLFYRYFSATHLYSFLAAEDWNRTKIHRYCWSFNADHLFPALAAEPPNICSREAM